MHASAVTDVGVVVDVVVNCRVPVTALTGKELIDPVAVEAYEATATEGVSSGGLVTVELPHALATPEAASPTSSPRHRDARRRSDVAGLKVDARLFYSCTPSHPHVAQRTFHYLNVLPFGLHRPCDVFGLVGRHTNLGLVKGMTEDGLVRIEAYAKPLQLDPVRSLPRLSSHDEAHTGAVIDPSCLSRIRRESRNPQVQQRTQEFFSRAAAHQEETRGRTSLRSSSLAPPGASMLPSTPTQRPPLGQSMRMQRRAPHRPSQSSAVAVCQPRRTLSPFPVSSSAAYLKEVGSASRPSRSDARTRAASRASVTILSLNAFELADDAPMAGSTVDGSDVPRELLCALSELQLPPCLALHDPEPPLHVGTSVVARRLGCAEVLHTGTVIAADFDVTYTIRYDADGGIDRGVLHNDVHALRAATDADVKLKGRVQGSVSRDDTREVCTVRDHVVVEVAARPQRAVVMAALGSGRFHVALASTPVRRIEVGALQVLFTDPILEGAAFAEPRHLALFRRLDPGGTGHVSWKNVRHFILSWEGFGHPLSFQRLGEIQRDICIRKRRVEPQLLWKVPVQEEEQQLSFRDFEYVLLRAENLL